MFWGIGFKYTFWMRLCKYFRGKSIFYFPLFIFCRLMHRRYTFKFGIQISYITEIGSGFYIGHFGLSKSADKCNYQLSLPKPDNDQYITMKINHNLQKYWKNLPCPFFTTYPIIKILSLIIGDEVFFIVKNHCFAAIYGGINFFWDLCIFFLTIGS